MSTDTEAAQLLDTLRRLRKDLAHTLLIAQETLDYRIPTWLGPGAQKGPAVGASAPGAPATPELDAMLRQLRQEMALLVPSDGQSMAQETELLRAEVKKDLEENKVVLQHYDQAIHILETQGAAGVTAAWVILEHCDPLTQSL